MRRTSSATPRGYSCYVVFPFLVYEETYTCLSIVGLRVVQQVATLESCENFLFASDFSEPYHVPFHVVFFRFFFQFLHTNVHFFSNVLTLYVSIFGRSPLVWWFFLTHGFLAPPVCSLGGPEPPHRLLGDIYPCCWGLGPWHICTLHAGFSWPTLPRWPMRVGRRYGNWSTKPR